MRTKDLATTARAETLRRNQTEPEQKLWYRVRDQRLAGLKFTRECPVGPFFADFACREARLIVELDGSQHAENVYDGRRDTFLVEQGYSVLRFWNFEVLQSMGAWKHMIATSQGKSNQCSPNIKPVRPFSLFLMGRRCPTGG